MSHLKSRPVIDVLVNKRGPVPEGASEYVRAKMLAAIAHVGPPVLAVRAKLTQAADPPASRPAIAQAVVDVNGHPVRAHCAADTMFEAVDLLQERPRPRPHLSTGASAFHGKWRRSWPSGTPIWRSPRSKGTAGP
ncbi:hypothetical protein [Streptomyces sp. NPDC054961]